MRFRGYRMLKLTIRSRETTITRLRSVISRPSSVVEHLHGKEGVASSILVGGSSLEHARHQLERHIHDGADPGDEDRHTQKVFSQKKPDQNERSVL